MKTSAQVLTSLLLTLAVLTQGQARSRTAPQINRQQNSWWSKKSVVGAQEHSPSLQGLATHSGGEAGLPSSGQEAPDYHSSSGHSTEELLEGVTWEMMLDTASSSSHGAGDIATLPGVREVTGGVTDDGAVTLCVNSCHRRVTPVWCHAPLHALTLHAAHARTRPRHAGRPRLILGYTPAQ
ncbi:uncharacterized protein [Procambarus clarkii]|uniref:uncharacterized protein n=1 Tax=Procambarus clarkii TaxID=6728 RepID=UPI0037441A1D